MFNKLKPDWYSQHPTRTPKADIAEYVRTETNIRVPRIFETLDDGMRFVTAGGTIIVRSESPDQYEGPSGIYKSYRISPDHLNECKNTWATKGNATMFSESKIAQAVKAEEYYFTKSIPHLGIIATASDVGQKETYRRLLLEQFHSTKSFEWRFLTGTPIEQGIAGNTFSVFEFIPGLNVTVVADAAKPQRWHIHSAHDDTIDDREYYGATLDNGNLQFKAGTPNHLTETQVRALVDAYEQIRHLGRFNADHCPIMEMQISDATDEIFFLQYHRTRDYQPAQSELNPDRFKAEDGWIQAEEVRGELALQSLELTIVYPSKNLQKLHRFFMSEKADMATANMNSNFVADELRARRRLRVGARGAEDLHSDWAIGHVSRSAWLKAQSGLVLPRGALDDAMGMELTNKIGSIVHRTETLMATLAVEAACDGDNGFLRIDRSRGIEGVLKTELP